MTMPAVTKIREDETAPKKERMLIGGNHYRALLQHTVVGSRLSAHYHNIRPKARRPSPSPDTRWVKKLKR